MEIITKAEAKAQGLNGYFTGKPCKHGHVDVRRVSNGQCVTCASDWAKSHRKDNPELWQKKTRKSYLKNRESKVEWQLCYAKKNREKIKRRISDNPMLSFSKATQKRIESLSISSSLARFESASGYTQSEFVDHIESLWEVGMAWSNRSEWHIDHIKPVSLFIKEGITDPATINALSNLQPLWAKDNLSKGASSHE